MDLAEAAYGATTDFPRSERFGLVQQIRRAAASIPANIAEGYGRGSRPEYLRFLRIANGSLKELETHLILATRLSITTDATTDPILEHADRLGRILRGLIRSLEASPK